MDYANSLKALRAKMIARTTGMDIPQTSGLESFIPARAGGQPPQEATEDFLTRTANWLSEIKDAAALFNNTYQIAESGSEARSSAGGFAKGLADGIRKNKEEKRREEEAKERKEAFITRRSEDSPSTYAPERPKEREERLDGENPSGVRAKFSGKEEFVDSLYPKAIEIGRQIGVDPRIILAQAALETGWGKSVAGNNFFGIKSHGRKGGVTVGTSEEVNGRMVRIRDSFRAYANADESFQDYADFLATNNRYLPMLAAKGLDAQLEALGRSGYATDSKYTQKLRSIINNLPDPEDYL